MDARCDPSTTLQTLATLRQLAWAYIGQSRGGAHRGNTATALRLDQGTTRLVAQGPDISGTRRARFQQRAVLAATHGDWEQAGACQEALLAIELEMGRWP